MRVNSSGCISSGGETYYVTKCVEGRRPLLAKPDSAEAIIDSLVFARAKGRIKLLAFVVMPDHYHVLLTLMPGEELSRFMQSIGFFHGESDSRSARLSRCGVATRRLSRAPMPERIRGIGLRRVHSSQSREKGPRRSRGGLDCFQRSSESKTFARLGMVGVNLKDRDGVPSHERWGDGARS